MNIPDVVGCYKRAENWVGVPGAGIWPRAKRKSGQEKGCNSGGLLSGWLGLVGAVAGNAGRPKLGD